MYLGDLIPIPSSPYLGVVGLTRVMLSRSNTLRFPISLLGDVWTVALCTGKAGGILFSMHEAGGFWISSAPPVAPSEMVWSSAASCVAVSEDWP